jgi:hypothetical protein
MRPMWIASPFVLAVVLAGGASIATAQLLPPRGGPIAPDVTGVQEDPHERLRFFHGNWEIAGLPAGRQFNETCDWLSPERRHLVCRARLTGSGAATEDSMSVMSYRASDGTYLYHGFTPDGAVHVMHGRRSGDVWQFSGEEGAGASLRRTRMTIIPGGERSFVLQQETSIGNGPWRREPDVRYVPAIGSAAIRR